MKNSTKVLMAIILVISAMGLRAQTANKEKGIYLTEQDYKNHKLSYLLESHDKLQLNEFMNGKNVSLTYQGKKIKLAKQDIFGYRLQGQDFRFYQNEAYRIIDSAGFLLYSRSKLVQQGKGPKPVEQFYFSGGANEPLLGLTVANLWNSFPKQVSFRYSLQRNFNGDADLVAYDKLSGQYKIKYLYFKQNQQVNAQASF
ncbi:hypothetical protein [Mucilaginibacter xinganensis]|uniref:Uncharacterized protein n=1 Tax=Mucilaginibacter xinganensis TaxID=1234841 RepID=A0A223NQR9_9SPHI|nr:hypothetical protein [Mucilaginibacter xinganensis]ASU32008.1 hypothetical protein MuYL_0105 [Mucilaginibacter xinganensis]